MLLSFCRILLLFLFLFFLNAHADELITEPEDGRAPLLSALQDAQHSIDLVVYGLTDEVFIRALIDAKNAGKEVNVLLEAAPYKSEHENDFAKQQLESSQVNVVSGNPAFKYTHQKTFILDHARAIVMTFNLTHSTFQHERNFALLVTDPQTVSEIHHVFDADVHRQNVFPRQSNLIWSPENSRVKMVDALKSANTQVDIYAENINDYGLVGVLGSLARKGITVRILHSSESAQSKKFRYLKRSGVQLKKSKKYLIHAKVIIVDHQFAILGSTNLTKNSLEHNRELSVVTYDPKVVDQLENTFQQDWGVEKTKRLSRRQSRLKGWIAMAKYGVYPIRRHGAASQ